MQSPTADGTQHLVPLDADHPGFRDLDYRRRRDDIARIALAHRSGQAVPMAEYRPEEDQLWAAIAQELAPLHARLACREILEANHSISLPQDRVPQLCEVNEQLAGLTGFQMEPVAGLIEAGEFLSRLAEGVFLSTQYIRHVSRPHYTPEPDVVHELIGHAASLAHPDIVSLNRAFGTATEAALAADDVERVEAIGRLYWYTLEYGLVREGNVPKALGAGLLSSVGEIQRIETDAEIHPFDAAEAAHTSYDPTTYQPVLFAADSFADLVADCTTWLVD